MNHSSDHQQHSDAVEISFVCPNEDKNETSDHLFGPGRTVGKAFDFGGRHIDTFLSKTEERMGYGPRVTAQRIRRRREVVEHAFVHYEGSFCWKCCRNVEEFLHSAHGKDHFCYKCYANTETTCRPPVSIQMKRKKVEKDIKLLLKYVNSRVLSTQKQAIDQILDLCIGDCELQALLKSKGATKVTSDSVQIYSKFRFSDFDDLVLSSSRKALISLGDAEINTLLQEWITVTKAPYAGDEMLVPLGHGIAPYLDNSETAFLVMRTFRKTINVSVVCWISDVCPDMIRSMVSSIMDSPSDFEWEECEVVFYDIFSRIILFPKGLQFFLVDFALRYADKMPRVISTCVRMLSMDINGMNSYMFSDVQCEKYAFVQGVTYTWGDDEETLSFDSLQSIYPYSPLQPLLRIIACPAERVFSDFVGSCPHFYSQTPSSAEFRVYSDVAGYIDSSDRLWQAKAWNIVNFFLALDIYRCDKMLEALSATSFGTTDDFLTFKQTKRESCIPKNDCFGFKSVLYRHLDRKDNHIHLHDGGACCPCDTIREEVMIYPDEWVLDARVERGMTFSSAGFYLLVAGYDADGKCLCVVRIWLDGLDCTECSMSAKDQKRIFCTITDGTKPEDLRIEVSCLHQKALRIPQSIDVIVLRHAPNAYAKAPPIPEIFDIFQSLYPDVYSKDLGAGEEGLDATGPFSWRPAKEHEVRREKYTVRVITAEEVIEGEEVLDGERHWPRDEGKMESDVEVDEDDLQLCDDGNGAERDSESGCLALLSRNGEDEAEPELETGEFVSQSDDGACQSEADLGLPICDGRTETESAPESNARQGKPGLGPEIDKLEYSLQAEERKVGSDSPQSNEIEFLSCDGGEEFGFTSETSDTGESDPLVRDEINYDHPGVDATDLDLTICDGGMKSGVASGSDETAPDETGRPVVSSGTHCAGNVAQLSMSVFHLAIIVILSFAFGFALKAYI